MDNSTNQDSNRDIHNLVDNQGLDISKDNQSNITDNQKDNSKPWLFQKGVSGNPAGRPKGKTLKEYQADKFRNMTDDQREEFLKEITKDIRWRMAEGNPHTTTDAKLEGEITLNISKEIADKHETNIEPSDNSKG